MHVVMLICDLRIYLIICFVLDLYVFTCWNLKVLCLLEGNASVLRVINVLNIKSSNKLKLFVCVLAFSDKVLSSLNCCLTSWSRLALNSFYFCFLFPKYSHIQFDFFRKLEAAKHCGWDMPHSLSC